MYNNNKIFFVSFDWLSDDGKFLYDNIDRCYEVCFCLNQQGILTLSNIFNGLMGIQIIKAEECSKFKNIDGLLDQSSYYSSRTDSIIKIINPNIPQTEFSKREDKIFKKKNLEIFKYQINEDLYTFILFLKKYI